MRREILQDSSDTLMAQWKSIAFSFNSVNEIVYVLHSRLYVRILGDILQN